MFQISEELARISLPPNLTREQASEALDTLLQRSVDAAVARGARPVGNLPAAGLFGRDVSVEDQKKIIVGQISGVKDGLVLVSYSAINAFQGEPVSITLRLFQNPVIYKDRQMIAMTRDLNEKVQTATAKAAGVAVKVDCVTCHRGVAVPRPLGDVLWETMQKQGVDAAQAQYRDLRKLYYGKQAYDFSEEPLLALGQRLSSSKPDDAIEILKLISSASFSTFS